MAFQTWSAISVASAGTTIADSGTDVISIISLVVSNPSNTAAQVEVAITDSTDVNKFRFFLDFEAGDSPFAMDTRMFLSGGDKLKVASDNSEVCVLMSGDLDTAA